MSKIEVNTVDVQCGSTLTLGSSGKTVQLATGASQSGFGRTGTVNWDTTVKTAEFTAVSGEGYFCNTTSGAFTVNLPAGSAGSIVSLKDYANTWDTNNLTVNPNGSEKINGIAGDAILTTEDQSITLLYIDSTKGWRAIQDSTSNVTGTNFITATGGTITTCGNYKIHTFTGPGTFCVSVGDGPLAELDYFVVAGGGGTGTANCQTGGGGAGGFRLSNSTSMPTPQTSPLANTSGLIVSPGAYPITVGAGGAPAPVPSPSTNPGSNSVFSTITSAGGGGGKRASPNSLGQDGGSGGGSRCGAGGAGNTPPVSPPQGNPGGTGNHTSPDYGSGGGGGAGAAGSNGSNSNPGAGPGGIGSYVVQSGFAGCNGTPGPVSGARYFAGGGGGGSECAAGTGGAGGGGAGANNSGTATAGGTNTGGGAGSGNNNDGAGKAGGSGIVILRYRYQ